MQTTLDLPSMYTFFTVAHFHRFQKTENRRQCLPSLHNFSKNILFTKKKDSCFLSAKFTVRNTLNIILKKMRVFVFGDNFSLFKDYNLERMNEWKNFWKRYKQFSLRIDSL